MRIVIKYREATLEEVIERIHENAVEHGWWDGERDTDEVYALIHSEWSEALEEARAGRPDKWYFCTNDDRVPMCKPGECELGACESDEKAPCKYREPKPEGICVELIDGIIRIFDYLGYMGEAGEYSGGTPDWYFEMSDPEGEEWARKVQSLSVGALVKRLHSETAKAGDRAPGDGMYADNLLEAVTVAWQWIKGRGLDPMRLLVEKHEYNKTRAYKHGKRF